MEYIVYKTTNLVNNKIYIGVHKASGTDKFGGYYGCGVNINRPCSYKIHVLFSESHFWVWFDNFKREILYTYSTAEEAYNKEKELVNKDFIDLDTNYNMVVGGTGGISFSREVYQFNLEGVLIQNGIM